MWWISWAKQKGLAYALLPHRPALVKGRPVNWSGPWNSRLDLLLIALRNGHTNPVVVLSKRILIRKFRLIQFQGTITSWNAYCHYLRSYKDIKWFGGNWISYGTTRYSIPFYGISFLFVNTFCLISVWKLHWILPIFSSMSESPRFQGLFSHVEI